MRWRAFATDFDGTIASDGVIDEPTKLAILKVQAAGMRTYLITGRELADFRALDVFLPMFDLVVAENGAVIFRPSSGESYSQGKLPPAEFISELTRRGVSPLSVGASIVATVVPHEVTVLELIKEMGLELQVIFNKGAVMILPSGVNKASGLRGVLKLDGLETSDVVAVGDGENDHALIEAAGLGAAVANAVPSLKEKADWVASHSAGAGVVELIEALLRGELEEAGKPLAAR